MWSETNLREYYCITAFAPLEIYSQVRTKNGDCVTNIGSCHFPYQGKETKMRVEPFSKAFNNTPETIRCKSGSFKRQSCIHVDEVGQSGQVKNYGPLNSFNPSRKSDSDSNIQQ